MNVPDSDRASQSRSGSVFPRYRRALLAAVVLCAMATDLAHPLWGSDEPREAEIARETLVENHWITPHLCGLPFLEKPPLYYDMVALAYWATGAIRPTVARSVSAALGLLMLASVFLIGHRWKGERAAWLSVLTLLGMPRFFRYSHWILLDIGVGAFCTAALAAFACFLWWSPRGTRRSILFVFYLACGCAFLTKGLVAIFHVAVTIGALCLVTRRWTVLREMTSPLPLLAFIAPVSLWVALYYREGGLAYLHEHFVNNTLGRFLRLHFEIAGARFYHTDLGNQGGGWDFYLTRLVDMIGVAIAVLPFAAWEAVRLSIARRSAPAGSGAPGDDVPIFLLSWAVLPAFVLSFAQTKEVTFILPSYAAMALLVGGWLDARLPRAGQEWHGVAWCGLVLPAAAATVLLSGLRSGTYYAATFGPLALGVLVGVFLLRRRWRTPALAFLVLAAVLSVTVVYQAPVARHRHRESLEGLAEVVWSLVGDAPLYLYRPRDALRGSIPFYANRTVREIDRPDELRSFLLGDPRVFVLMREGVYEAVQADPSLRPHFVRHDLPELHLAHRFELISGTPDPIRRPRPPSKRPPEFPGPSS